MTTEQATTLGALQTAIKMEIDGKQFYKEASRTSANKLGKNLLQRLSQEEDIHRKVFENIFKAIGANKGWPGQGVTFDGGQGLRTVFSEAMETVSRDYKPIPTELDAVQKAMDMENKTYDFYVTRGSTAAFPAEREFYDAIAAQEKEHHRVLLDYFEFLTNPAAYFVLKEHPSIDGG